MKICISQGRSPKPREAFTLIELLVVISIIALLAAILFPVFQQVRAKAQATSCASNMRQIALGFNQYQSDYDGRLPQAWDSDLTIAGTAACNTPANCLVPIPGSVVINDPVVWPAKLEPYLKTRQLFSCPTVSKQQRGPCDPSAASAYNIGWQIGDPVVGIAGQSSASRAAYGYNIRYLGGGQYWGIATIQQTRYPATGPCQTCGIAAPESTIAKPAATILIIDNNYTNMGADAPPAFANVVYTDGEGALRCAADGSWDRHDSYDPRHLGGLNVAFVDGHVKWMRKEKALYRPPAFNISGNVSYASDDNFLWDRE